MKVLLVGARSALGCVLRPEIESFAEVVTAGRRDCDVILDLTWPREQFELPAGLDAAVNLAVHYGGTDFDAMLAAEMTNALGALKFADACARAGIGHLLLVSSLSAVLADDSPYFSAYALSKRHAEELTRMYCRAAHLPLAILRPAQIYGDGDEFRGHQPLLYTVMDRAERGEEIVLFGGHDARRNYIHGEDVAKIIALMLRQRLQGSFDCAGISPVRVSELAAAAVTAFGSSSTIRFDPNLPDIPDNIFVADESLYREIGYQPRIPIERGLARQAAQRRRRP